ncbi:hypothetical protein GCM10027168_19580 [Streptomyces capparidis]
MNEQEQPAIGGAETALAGALRAGAEGVQPRTAHLVAGGLERGRRMRARRARVVGVTVAVAAVAATAGAVAAVTGGADRPGDVAAVPSPSAPAAEELTRRHLTDQVSGLLPRGVTVRWDKAPDAAAGKPAPGGAGKKRAADSGGGKSAPHDVAAGGVLTDARGSGQAHVTVRRAAPKEGPPVCPDLTGTAATCTVTRLADGSALRLERNFEYPATPGAGDGKAGPQGGGAEINSVQLVRTDGVVVFLQSSDTEKEKSGRATRPAPVLSLEQLRTIVTDPSWRTLPDPAPFPSGKG